VNARCAQWPRLEALVAARLERLDDAEALLSAAALAHLEECGECRRAALALDPTLALLPLVERETAADDEVESMLRAVETLRRSPAARRRAPAVSTGWRTAAAIVLAAGALYQLPARGPRIAARPSADAVLESLASRPVDNELVRAEFSGQPVLEDLDRPDARVYQLGGDDVSVVMIVDETLDV
jgi:hypothetical protein